MNKQIVSIYINEHYGEKAPSSKKLKKDNIRIYNALYEYTGYLPQSATITERAYNVANGISDRVLCACGKVLKFKSYKNGYGTKCSKDCKG
jgi:hypothetical protein